jgi:hypothetical protein
VDPLEVANMCRSLDALTLQFQALAGTTAESVRAMQAYGRALEASVDACVEDLSGADRIAFYALTCGPWGMPRLDALNLLIEDMADHRPPDIFAAVS